MGNSIDEGIQSNSDESAGSNEGARVEENMPVSAQYVPKRDPTQATELVRLAEGARLFRNGDGEAFASFENNRHTETYPLRSGDFRSYLATRFCEERNQPPSSQALCDALNVLEGQAMQNPKTWPVHVRVASGDGAMWLNLADEKWRVVQVTASEGWRVLTKSPVYFRKPRGMKPLPEPVPGGSVEELRKFVNVGSEDDFILLVHWIIAALNADGPYPILVLQGEQGAAKSTTARIVRALVDPSASPIRSLPRSERDLMVSAKNGWILSYDNISKLSDQLADAFCRLATGGGLSPRRLYSDDDEVLLDAKRPVILNGIEALAVRSDLADRAIVLHLPTIPETRRQLEGELWKEFNAAQSRILGALLTAVQCALHNEGSFKRPKYSRMADFHHRAVAATPGLPWDMEQFEASYRANQATTRETALEADGTAEAVKELVKQEPYWEGTPTDLLAALKEVASDEDTLPRGSNWLSNRLTRLAPALREIGIEVVINKQSKPKVVTIYCSPQFAL